MEGIIVNDWEKFKKEIRELEDADFYVDTEDTPRGNVLRVYADTPGKTVILELQDLDIRELKKRLDLLGIKYTYGKRPVNIEEREKL